MLITARSVALGSLLSLVAEASGSASAATVTAPVVFKAPSAHSPAGPTSAGDAFGRILPSGRIVHPTGSSVVVGMNAQGLALAPSGAFAIVSNDDDLQATTAGAVDGTFGGYTLAVVAVRTMTVASVYRQPLERFFGGVVALEDPAAPANTLVLASGEDAVYAFDLDASGNLTPDAHHTIALGAHAGPGTIVLSPRGDRAYVVDNLGNDIAQIDTATRALVGAPIPVGYFPYGAALSSAGLLIANEGLMAYGQLPAPSAAPSFEAPPADPARAASLSVIDANPDGSLGTMRTYVPLDRAPDGVLDVGGAHPAAVVAMRSKPFAFVALSNVDRIATISLESAQPRAAGGTELRLYNRGPYGTQPDALALSRDERRLYVALAGIDAVAVLDTSDPRHPHRIGLIPTGWEPTALALSDDGRYLYVANAKGIAHDSGFTGDQPGSVDAKGHIEFVGADSTAVWSTLERVDLTELDLRRATPLALSYLRTITPARKNTLVPQRFGTAGSTSIKHVVLVLQGSKTFDAALGDLVDFSGRPYGPGDPSLVSFDASVTPNLHAIARAYALAGNFYADSVEPNTGALFATAGMATAYTQKMAFVNHIRGAAGGHDENPEDYPRAGYIFNSLAQRGKTYRDYGGLLGVSGYDDGNAPDPVSDDPAFAGVDDIAAPVQTLGGLYALNVPALLALSGHVDLNYPGLNPRIRNVRRAREFLRDFDALVQAKRMPAFTAIWLPGERATGGKNVPATTEQVADGDRALGQIVEYLTHLPDWKSTAIFIMPVDAQMSRDHVDVNRSYAIVVSPFAKRHFIGLAHLSTASVLKTEEELLGLPALSLGDALASDMSDFFTRKSSLQPYTRIDAAPQT